MKKHQSILAASVLLLTIPLLVSMCKKYRPEGDELAQYQFVNTAGICSGTVISGEYHAAIALIANNAIMVQVNVTKVGKYTIATTSLNNVQFSAVGKFTSTGVQTVRLQGTGKPAAKGIFAYNTSGASACAFVLTVDEKSVDYAVYTVYETYLVCQQPVLHGQFIKSVPLSTMNTAVFNIHVVAPGAFAIFTDNVNGIYFNASGTFTATGDQTVILHGFGTPADTGNFNFNLHAGNGSCSFRVSCTSS